jgi:hypothetical protein
MKMSKSGRIEKNIAGIKYARVVSFKKRRYNNAPNVK